MVPERRKRCISMGAQVQDVAMERIESERSRGERAIGRVLADNNYIRVKSTIRFTVGAPISARVRIRGRKAPARKLVTATGRTGTVAQEARA